MPEISTKEYVTNMVARARAAQAYFEANYNIQRQVDEVVRACAVTIYDAREELSRECVEETGMGSVNYKVTKIIGTCTAQWNTIRGHKSFGYIDNWRDEPGVRVIAKAIGVVSATCPATNPIITGMANAMMAIKCRNAVIVCPHPKAKHCSYKAMNMIRAAIKALGAPEDLLQCVAPEYCSIETTNEVLHQCDVNIATGGPGMVKSVYSCGKPGFGVGQGNTQEIICDDWEDYEGTCRLIVANRAWDQGVPCTGDQMIHVPATREEQFLAAMEKGGAYIIRDVAILDKLRAYIFPDGKTLNRDVVGKSPTVVGKAIGLDIPEDRLAILAKVEAVGTQDVLCKEILFPFSRYRTYESFEATVEDACTNLRMEGAGHNSSIWTNDGHKVEYASMRMPVCRLMVNQVPLGKNNGLRTTPTLGCGFWSGNSLSENLEWYHMYQTTRVTTYLPNRRPFKPGDFDCFDIAPVLE